MGTVNLKINGMPIVANAGETVLEVAGRNNIDIPTLCYLKGINQIGACRICVVEVAGMKTLQASCCLEVREGMEIVTNSDRVIKARRNTLELILSDHDRKCLTCSRNCNCELQTLAAKFGIDEIPYEGVKNEFEIDRSSPSIERNQNKCIFCRRCESACKQVQSVSVIGAKNRGFKAVVGCAFDMPLAETPCINCGQCIVACPVGAIKEKSDVDEAWRAIRNPDLHVIFQTAPAVRVAIGEEFGFAIGSRVTGKMVASIRALGVDKVLDTNAAADFTIMEEGTELLSRLQGKGKLPLITSCSPGWVKFCEHNFPDFLDNLSSAKSPHQMMGALVKTYYAKKAGIDPSKIFVVSVMPCTAKKFECKRDELAVDGLYDVDLVITTRECARMIKQAGIDFANMEPEQFDDPFGEGTGAGVIFGATGGVMEAALRTVSDILSGGEVKEIEYNDIRGEQGIKEASVDVAGKEIRLAVAHGLGNARRLLNNIRAGKADYDFIEIMACPGGCVTGGGQPIVNSKNQSAINVKAERAKATYDEDRNLAIRKSHEHPVVQKVYKEFLGEPCGHLAHELLHTHYAQRSNY